MKDYILYSGSSNLPLAQEVAKILNISLGNVDLTRFADGELRPWIQDDIRDKTVIVLESLSYPMDEHVMELVLMGDAIRRCAPKRTIAVIPYLGYARQDKLHRPGEPVSARVMVKFLEVSQFAEIIGVDFHNNAIVGFFEIPVTHVTAMDVVAAEVQKLNIKDGVVVSPDVGGSKRARNMAYFLDMPLAVMEKKRFLDRHDTTETYEIIGEVKGKTAIICDDVISTGGTTVNAAYSLKEAGATRIIATTTHGIFAKDAVKKLMDSPIELVFSTNTVLIPKEKQFDKLRVVSAAPLLANAISTLVR